MISGEWRCGLRDHTPATICTSGINALILNRENLEHTSFGHRIAEQHEFYYVSRDTLLKYSGSGISCDKMARSRAKRALLHSFAATEVKNAEHSWSAGNKVSRKKKSRIIYLNPDIITDKIEISRLKCIYI